MKKYLKRVYFVATVLPAAVISIFVLIGFEIISGDWDHESCQFWK